MNDSVPESATRLALSGDWRIGRLEPLRAYLQAALQPAPVGLLLESTEITHIDTLGLQLLAVFVQQCLRRQITIAWSSPAPLLQDAAARLGLGEILALPAATPV